MVPTTIQTCLGTENTAIFGRAMQTQKARSMIPGQGCRIGLSPRSNFGRRHTASTVASAITISTTTYRVLASNTSHPKLCLLQDYDAVLGTSRNNCTLRISLRTHHRLHCFPLRLPCRLHHRRLHCYHRCLPFRLHRHLAKLC